MDSKIWDLAGFTDRNSKLGRPVPGGLIAVPFNIALSPDRCKIVWGRRPDQAKQPVRHAKPDREMLRHFVQLWQKTPKTIVAFARKWGVLNLNKDGRPCRPIGPSDWSEPIESWRYYSRRAQAVLNIAANLRLGKLGALDDWSALRETASRTGDLLPELDRVEPFLLTMIARTEYPFGEEKGTNPKFERSVKLEKLCLGMEVTLWLRLGRVSFTVAHEDPGWTLAMDYNGCMLAAIALQLALVLAEVEALYRCSGCQEAYVRTKKAPKPGQANYCNKCGRQKALQRADQKRRAKQAEARRFAEEGMSVPDIAGILKSTQLTIRRWIRRNRTS